MSATVSAGPAPTTTAPETRWRPADQAIVTAFVLLLVLTQRIGIPVANTSIALALPLTFLFVVLLLVRGSLTVSRVRAELYLLATIACIGVTAAVAITGATIYLTSLILLVVIYLPWILRVPGRAGQQVVRRTGRTFVRIMLLLSAVGAAQFATQLVGAWRYTDYLGEVLPPNYLVPNYNTHIPLVYGSDTYKSNAFVLLEPSVLSQFCALALIIGLMLHIRAWQILLLVAGLASAVSGTGVLLLGAGGLFLLLRDPRRLRPGYVAAFAVAIVLVLLSPVFSLLAERTGEFTTPGSSGYARFVAPYAEVVDGLVDEPMRYLTGEGAGTVDRVLASARDKIGDDVLYGVVPKLVFEYGLIAGGLFILFLVISMLDRTPWRVVPGAVLLMSFFLGGGLLQPQTTALAWLLTSMGASDDDPDDQPDEELPASPVA